MKKLIAIAIGSISATVMANDPSPVIGVTQISTEKQNTIVAVPFTSLDGSGPVKAKDLVSTEGFQDGDAIYIFDAAATPNYSAWMCDNGAWTPANPVGNVPYSAPNQAATLTAGSGIWIVLTSKPTSAKNFSIFGKLASDVSVTTGSVGMKLIGNPLQSRARITVSNPAPMDSIIIPNDDQQPLRYDWRYSKKNKTYSWYDGNGDAVSVEDLPVFEIGHGCWYSANGTETVIGWTAINE